MNRKENLKKKGCQFERKAGTFLEERGYRILEYNFRCPYAEIDIIAKKGNVLIFCEVKYRKGTEMMSPLEAVHRRKMQRISAAALFYIAKHPDADCQYRFDVIGMNDKEVIHIKNAFAFGGQ